MERGKSEGGEAVENGAYGRKREGDMGAEEDVGREGKEGRRLVGV